MYKVYFFSKRTGKCRFTTSIQSAYTYSTLHAIPLIYRKFRICITNASSIPIPLL